MKITPKSLVVLIASAFCISALAGMSVREVKIMQYDGIEVCFENAYQALNMSETVTIDGKKIEIRALGNSANSLSVVHATIDEQKGCVTASVTGYRTVEKGREIFKLLDITQE